jgi:hypothetical protein
MCRDCKVNETHRKELPRCKACIIEFQKKQKRYAGHRNNKCHSDPTQLYRHYDKEGRLLYIGLSYSAWRRLVDHAIHSPWFQHIAVVTIETLPNRAAAIEAEREAIRVEKPLMNTMYNRGSK